MPIAIIIDSTTTLTPARTAKLQEICSPSLTTYLLLTHSEINCDKFKHYFSHILNTPIDTKDLYQQLHKNGSAISLEHPNIQRISTERFYNINRSLHILVGDDQETNLYVYRQILEKQGHRVTTAANGDDALSLLEEIRFDLAILDLHMPGLSGLDVVKMLKFTAADHQIPIIIVTANTSESVIKECLTLADGYLSKPIDRIKLLQTIKLVLTRSSATRPANALNLNHAALESLELFDASYFENQRELFDVTFVNTLFDVFHNDFAKLFTSIETAVENNNIEHLCETLHAIKGIASDIRAIRLAKLSSYLHNYYLLNEFDTPTSNTITNTLYTTYEDTRSAMNKYLGHNRATSH